MLPNRMRNIHTYTEADALSRIPWPEEEVVLDQATVKVTINLGCARGSSKWAEAYAGKLKHFAQRHNHCC